MKRESCSRCGGPNGRAHAWCRSCFAAYVRQYRADGREVLREDGRRRRNARSAVRMRVTRGTMTKEPCEVCGTTTSVEAHHDDYDRPFDVRWLCSTHHRAVHT